MYASKDIKTIFTHQLKNNTLVDYSGRINYLVRIEKWINKHRKEIIDAHYLDLGKPESETQLAEIWYVLSEIKIAKKNLKKWMRPKKVGQSTLALFTARSWLHYEPRGVVLIISPWNFPFNLTIGPLVSALASGNRIIIKPSEFSPNVSSLIEKMINENFKSKRVALLTGESAVAKELLKYPFDHIFFTGSPKVGKKVMAAASSNLVSITLELGGKTPTIVDDAANIKMAIKKIIWGKCLNLGQSCIAPDYILIHESKKDEFMRNMAYQLNDIYGNSFDEKINSPDLSRIVNNYHYDRLEKLLANAIKEGARVIYGGGRNRKKLFIELTLLDMVNMDMELMKEEIFGPLFPIISYSDLGECLDIINKNSKPLALYMFSESKINIKKVVENTSTGGMIINEVKSHFLNLDLPFGGVNASGIGRSHGYDGFITFSNVRSMQENGSMSMISLVFPPYTEWTKKIVRFITRFL